MDDSSLSLNHPAKKRPTLYGTTAGGRVNSAPKTHAGVRHHFAFSAGELSHDTDRDDRNGACPLPLLSSTFVNPTKLHDPISDCR